MVVVAVEAKQMTKLNTILQLPISYVYEYHRYWLYLRIHGFNANCSGISG